MIRFRVGDLHTHTYNTVLRLQVKLPSVGVGICLGMAHAMEIAL